MADLLGEVDHNAYAGTSTPVKTVKSESRRKVRVLSPGLPQTKARCEGAVVEDDENFPDTRPAQTAMHDDDDEPRVDMDVNVDEAPQSEPVLPSSPITGVVERKVQNQKREDEVEDDDLLDVAPAVGHSRVGLKSVNMSGSRPAPVVKKIDYSTPRSSSPTRHPLETIDASSWKDVTTKLNVISSSADETISFGKLSAQDALEPDGSLRMFWLDYIEVNGSLCLFGKVKNRSTGGYVSCFVKVNNILRKLYFLPKKYRYRGFSTFLLCLWLMRYFGLKFG